MLKQISSMKKAFIADIRCTHDLDFRILKTPTTSCSKNHNYLRKVQWVLLHTNFAHFKKRKPSATDALIAKLEVDLKETPRYRSLI